MSEDKISPYDNPSAFMSLKNVAKFFDVSNATIKNWYRSGRFPSPVVNPLDESESAHKFFKNEDLIKHIEKLKYEEPA